MNKGKKVPHKIMALSLQTVQCFCGWHQDLKNGEYGVRSGYDRLLDLFNDHVKTCNEPEK